MTGRRREVQTLCDGRGVASEDRSLECLIQCNLNSRTVLGRLDTGLDSTRTECEGPSLDLLDQGEAVVARTQRVVLTTILEWRGNGLVGTAVHKVGKMVNIFVAAVVTATKTSLSFYGMMNLKGDLLIRSNLGRRREPEQAVQSGNRQAVEDKAEMVVDERNRLENYSYFSDGSRSPLALERYLQIFRLWSVESQSSSR